MFYVDIGWGGTVTRFSEILPLGQNFKSSLAVC